MTQQTTVIDKHITFISSKFRTVLLVTKNKQNSLFVGHNNKQKQSMGEFNIPPVLKYAALNLLVSLR